MKKFIKIISLVLALVIALAAFVSCEKKNEDVPGDVNTPVTGGWQFSDKSVSDITADEKAVFDEAIKGHVGVDYAPKTVIAKQVVAGINYAFLCVSQIVAPNSTPYWSVVTVYKSFDGNVELLCINAIDSSDVKTTKNNSAEAAAGAWSAVEREEGLSISTAVDEAISSNIGVTLVPVTVLATQLVAGRNYRVLAYGETVTATPACDLYVVDVYETLDGKAEITSANVFDLIEYIEPSNGK